MLTVSRECAASFCDVFYHHLFSKNFTYEASMTAKTKGSLKLPHAAARANVNNATSCTSAVDLALSHTDDPGGDVDDPGGGSANDGGSFSSFTTSASTLSRTPASYVSSSLTTRVSLLKSTADIVECTDVDYATGSFCSSCSIPPLIGLVEKDLLCVIMTITAGVDLGSL